MQLSAPVLPFARSREAERLQRALDGRLRAAELTPTLGGYAAVAGRLSELVPTTALHPSPEYRAELHTRLVELATARAAGRPAPLADRRASTDRRAVLPWLAGLLSTWSRRGWRRSLAAATSALLTLCVGVGFAAGSALPGGLLYPVKELIQSAQVQLAGGGLDRGAVLLDQARGHLRDAGTLVGQGSPDPADVDTALRAASADLSDAQRTLLAQFARSQDPAALTALAGPRGGGGGGWAPPGGPPRSAPPAPPPGRGAAPPPPSAGRPAPSYRSATCPGPTGCSMARAAAPGPAP